MIQIGLFLKDFFSTQPDIAVIKILLFLIFTLILVAGIENTNNNTRQKKLWKITSVLIALISILGLKDKTIYAIITTYSYITILIFLGFPIIGILFFLFKYKNNTTIGSFIKTITFGITTLLLDRTYTLIEYYNPILINNNNIISIGDIIDIILLTTLILFFYYLFDFVSKLFFKEEEKDSNS